MLAPWTRLWRLLGGARVPLATAAVVAAIQTALLAPVALIVRDLFDDRIPAGDSGGVVVQGLVIAALILTSGAVGLVARRMAVRRSKTAIAKLRVDLLRRLYGLPRSWHDARDPGRLQSVVVDDTERLDQLTNSIAIVVLPALLVTATLGVVALALDPVLFAVLALAAPLSLFSARYVGGRARRAYRTWHGRHAGFASGTRVALRAMTLTKVHGAEQLELQRREREAQGLRSYAEALGHAQATHISLQVASAAIVGVAVLIAGGVLVTEGHRTLGDLLAFYAIAALLLRQLSTALHGIAQTSIADETYARLDDLRTATAPTLYDGTRRIDFKGGVTVEDVHFAYDDTPVLVGAEVDIAPGEYVALVGPNGSGKSTLASLILGLYRPQQGRILFDGVPFEELDVAALRARVGVVLQDPVILPATIRENIAYGAPDATEDDVRRAARAADAEPFIERLPDGYDTNAGEEGNRLSGGQRQRIAIARALLGDPALLVLDEPTTHLDREGIAGVVRGLRSLSGRPTVLVVTHDPAAATGADRVVHLRDGRVERVDDRAAERAAAG